MHLRGAYTAGKIQKKMYTTQGDSDSRAGCHTQIFPQRCRPQKATAQGRQPAIPCRGLEQTSEWGMDRVAGYDGSLDTQCSPGACRKQEEARTRR